MLAHLAPYRWRVAALFALASAEVALRVLLPWPMKAIVDQALESRPVTGWVLAVVGPEAAGDRRALLASLVAAGLILQVLHQVVLLAHTRIYTTTGHEITRDLRQQVFMQLQGLNLRHHTRTPVGDSIYRLETDTLCLEQLLLRGLLPLTFSAVTLVVMFAVLAAINVWLAVASLSVIPPLFVWIKWSARRIRPGAEETRRLESRLTARMHESFAAIRLVKSFAREPYEGLRFASASNAAMRARILISTREAVFSSVVGFLIVAGTSLVIYVGGQLVLGGAMTTGTLLVAMAYLGFVYGPLSGIANTTGTIHQALASARRIRDTLGLTPEPREDPHAIAPRRLAGRIVFDQVSFGYDGHQVLDHVSFVAQPGTITALVGKSGSGKTTLISLIPRLYSPIAGRVQIDGEDVSHYRLAALREQIAIVAQEPVILSGTVRENIRYGRLDASDAEIEAAAAAAHADEFIRVLPRGYDTELGEAGAGLSGGQKQRLSIARAFLKNAPILLLDEPTAALDTIAERLVLSAIASLQAGRTTIVIAHRLSTVQNADRILVLSEGRVVAEGTHAQLMEANALYRALAAQLTEDPGIKG